MFCYGSRSKALNLSFEAFLISYKSLWFFRFFPLLNWIPGKSASEHLCCFLEFWSSQPRILFSKITKSEPYYVLSSIKNQGQIGCLSVTLNLSNNTNYSVPQCGQSFLLCFHLSFWCSLKTPGYPEKFLKKLTAQLQIFKNSLLPNYTQTVHPPIRHSLLKKITPMKKYFFLLQLSLIKT